MESENIYEKVPGQGQLLRDGTWWTNSKAAVGHVCVTPYYFRKVESRTLYAADKRSKCVEKATFDGKPFCRWEALEPTPFRACNVYMNYQLEYK